MHQSNNSDFTIGRAESAETDSIRPAWWHALEWQEPAPEMGCSEPGCASEVIDLYCDQHDNFLPLGGVELSKAAWGGVVGAGIAVYVTFWVAAHNQSLVPLYLFFAVSAGVLLWLTLRRLSTARATAQVLWATSVTTVVAFQLVGESGRKWLLSLIIVISVLLWILHILYARVPSSFRISGNFVTVRMGTTLLVVCL